MYRVFYIYEKEGEKYLNFVATDNYEVFMNGDLQIYYVTDKNGEIIIDNRNVFDT